MRIRQSGPPSFSRSTEVGHSRAAKALVDGDGFAEFVGSTGYKGYVLRRILPQHQVLVTSHSGV
jgi:hypothetical protein